MTKWEKFRLEKGMTARKRRSRMVWDERVKDWVPRWGAYSTKKIDDKMNWVMEVKKNQDPNVDLFDQRAKGKNMTSEKQKLRELKNQMFKQKVNTTQVNQIAAKEIQFDE